MHAVDQIKDLRAIVKAARETYRRTFEDITSDGHEIERARRVLPNVDGHPIDGIAFARDDTTRLSN
jgi:hypothetical protein